MNELVGCVENFFRGTSSAVALSCVIGRGVSAHEGLFVDGNFRSILYRGIVKNELFIKTALYMKLWEFSGEYLETFFIKLLCFVLEKIELSVWIVRESLTFEFSGSKATAL